MSSVISFGINATLKFADPSWEPILLRGLEAVADADPHYLPNLAEDSYLPTENRLFAAFAQPLDKVRYVLVGEGRTRVPRARPASVSWMVRSARCGRRRDCRSKSTAPPRCAIS